MAMGRITKWMACRHLAAWMAVAAISGCAFLEEPAPGEDATRSHQLALLPVCAVQVEGQGSVAVDTDFIPKVLACTMPDAPLAALRLEAIALRTHAQYINEVLGRPVKPNASELHYDCGAQPQPSHFEAANATSRKVLTYQGKLIAPYFVPGAVPSSASCVALMTDPDPTLTQPLVTYNNARTGAGVRQAGATLALPGQPGNRGARSRNGVTCLANQGWAEERIARFFYGDDVRVQTSTQTCDASQSGSAGGATSGASPAPANGLACQFDLSLPGQGSGSNCDDSAQTPEILPRSAWGAAAARALAPTHRPTRITLHHTDTPNNSPDPLRAMRDKQASDMRQGLRDIGLHFIVTPDGRIYRGVDEGRVGEHVSGQNPNNLGIGLLGNYSQAGQQPSDVQLKTTARLLRHLASKYRIPLDATQIKTHAELGGANCPGSAVSSQMANLLEWAKAEVLCPSPNPTTSGVYRYVKIMAVSDSPSGINDNVPGFEVDSVFMERTSISASVGRLGALGLTCGMSMQRSHASLGLPDNTTCENRASTVAAVATGGELVVQLPQGLREGDVLHVVQHAYTAALANCSPSGTARILVSEDGGTWKVMASDVSGNWRRVLRESDLTTWRDAGTSGAAQSQLFRFISPRAGMSYPGRVSFKVDAQNPAITKVEYYSDGFAMGSSSDAGRDFQLDYTFQSFGRRTLVAKGLDASGQQLGTATIAITVTRADGSIPAGGSSNAGGGSGGGSAAGVPNSALAERLAIEGGKCQDNGAARCRNGRGGGSLGKCWRYVSFALDRARLPWSRLASAGPCSSGTFYESARGFKCNADGNPGILQSMGLKRINVPATQAPRGSIIAWERGCLGYHARYGHIEIAMGDGNACSDYCGRIRGNATCVSVYAPVQ